MKLKIYFDSLSSVLGGQRSLPGNQVNDRVSVGCQIEALPELATGTFRKLGWWPTLGSKHLPSW